MVDLETSKRRSEIITYLCQHRFSTVGNLANEFGVSERTIRRDIEFLSLSEPIYTQSGRYGGGVYIMDNYYSNRGYFTKEEVILMKKILDYIERISTEHFTADEVYLFKNILKNYKKPHT